MVYIFKICLILMNKRLEAFERQNLRLGQAAKTLYV